MEPIPPADGTTPIDDLSGLKLRKLKTLSQLYVAEAENIRRPHVKYLSSRPGRRLAPFDVPWMKRLHREMFGRVWRWGGEPRKSDLNIGSTWIQIEADLLGLEQTLAFYRTSDMPLVEQAMRLHHRSVAIHPFPNGNGRWGRLLSNIWLKQNGGEPTAWPEAMHVENDIRGEYLMAMRTADAGDFAPLMQMHQRYTPTPLS
ncbi:MAG TPA: mobile mystery protein B [Pirellulales bacterium]|jgi:Fic-DOC domain mobile mystery protein B|nr:mobile mystery protein B [Pirellulales bacterium]